MITGWAESFVLGSEQKNKQGSSFSLGKHNGMRLRRTADRIENALVQ